MLRKILITLSIILVLGLSQNLYVKNDNQVRLSPRLINYQGYLTDTLGIPITNPALVMTFSIYDAQSAGNLKWTENQTVSVSKGIFNVILGINTPIPDSVFNNPNRWLQLTVDGQVLIPRTRIVSTAYAYTATYSDTAQYAKSAAADNDWIITGNNMYSGVSGNVGIGTTSPGAKLDVAGHIWQTGTGNSVFLGQGAGFNDDLTYNNNVFVGYQAGYNNTTGYDNTALGYRALFSNTNGTYNTANGFQALYFNTAGGTNTANGGYALYSNTTGTYNTANGGYALYSNTTGNNNTASGVGALSSNTIGSNNTASGLYALSMNTTAGHNIAIGERALYSQSYDNAGTPWNSFNIALGDSALYTNQPTSTLNGIYNTAIGHRSLRYNTTGPYNTALGYQALYSNTTSGCNAALGSLALYSNTTGWYNTAVGHQALYSNTTSGSNTALGYRALYSNAGGWRNVASGTQALYSNTGGSDNTASGYWALYSNTTGCHNIAIGERALYSQSYDNAGTPWNSFNIALGDSALYSNQPTSTSNGIYNTALGHRALRYNTTGQRNTAIGYQTLYSNTTGWYNIASGYQALYSNTTGHLNTAIGYQTLYSNTTGIDNTAIGHLALYYNTTSFNTAIGSSALYSNTTGGYNTASGYQALYNNTTGSYNTALGSWAYPASENFSNTMALGYSAQPTASNRVHVGNTSVTWIGGQVTWSTYSDARAKTDVRENIPGLEFIMKLKPVSFKWDTKALNQLMGVIDTAEWRGKYDIEKKRISGFLAQDVARAARECGYDFSGIDSTADVYSLSYAQFVVPLVKSVQELKALNEQQQAEIEQLKAQIKALQEKMGE